jgi:hypothetical protein
MGKDAVKRGPRGIPEALPWRQQDAMILTNRYHKPQVQSLQRRSKLPTRAIQAIGSHHLKLEALLLESLNEVKRDLRFGFVLLSGL